jgi:WXXGXW repeat (2 copies)
MVMSGSIRKILFAGILLAVPAGSFAQLSIGVSINIPPPGLPVYLQPPCPEPNYMWTPGFWAWDAEGGEYYWVPGTWVFAPQPGYLWTPGYWGWGDGGLYIFHTGYWGPQVGFYGGVNYGFGYGGAGFGGGEWRGGNFAYNTAAVNVNTTVIHNTYVNTTVINNTTILNNNHTSFNGGPNGVAARPTPAGADVCESASSSTNPGPTPASASSKAGPFQLCFDKPRSTGACRRTPARS